jgi:hypothetical protein
VCKRKARKQETFHTKKGMNRRSHGNLRGVRRQRENGEETKQVEERKEIHTTLSSG